MINKSSFNHRRLKFARKRRGVTIKDISGKIDITTRAYSNYENGQRVPPKNTLELLSSILDFPTQFFYLDDPIPLDTSCVSFRSLARMSAKVRDQALHAGQIALEFSKWLDSQFDLPMSDLPDLRNYEPEAAAETLRSEWVIGELPIKNIIHLLEAKGVRVFSLDEETQDMDAYSFWQDSVPFIFSNTRKTVERSRFDAAHELGHLILHKHGDASGKEVEAEANRFASAFLMPQGSVVSRSTKFTTLNWLISAKTFWRVSAAALVRRLSDLKIITEWQYRTLSIELSKRGYMKKEPNAIKERELSKLLPMVFQTLRQDKISKNDIASDLGVYAVEIDKLLFNLTLTQMNGGGASSLRTKKDRSHLKVVK
ncbi:MAG: XRE family transcriptional regulator [Thermodesulfobacteriota bacterium]